jgi:hypothetical protein
MLVRQRRSILATKRCVDSKYARIFFPEERLSESNQKGALDCEL